MTMYNKTLLPVFLLLFCTNAFAQNKVIFEVTLSDAKVEHSLYNSINLEDSRTNVAGLGYVQTGVYNKVTKVTPPAPFSAEIKRILASLLGTDAGNSELLLQLRQFSFAELTNAIGEYGYCTVKAEMYAKKGTGYLKINSLDTLVQLRSSIDVTNPILRSGSMLLTVFIQASLTMLPATDARIYTYNDVMHIDSIEKKALPLYNTSSYTDGLYLTYQSFKTQLPDKQGITIENDYVYPGFVKAPDEKGKLRDVKLKKTYAIVYKGTPYIVTAFGFYPLKKVKNEFTFTGMAKTPPSAASLIIVNGMFGTTGTSASSGNESTYEMMIDHQNGSIIKLKELPAVKATSTNDGWD